MQAGFDVRLLGDDDGSEPGVDSEPQLVVDEQIFARWLELSACSLGTVVAQWWLQRPAGRTLL